MATKAPRGGALAPSTFTLADTVGQKVVRLPTAAPRQVKQNHNRWGRAARQALRESQLQPWEYIFPQRRLMMREAELLHDMKRTPAAILAASIFATLDEQHQNRVRIHIACHGASREAKQAQALIAKRSVGQLLDLEWAITRLLSQGRA